MKFRVSKFIILGILCSILGCSDFKLFTSTNDAQPANPSSRPPEERPEVPSTSTTSTTTSTEHATPHTIVDNVTPVNAIVAEIGEANAAFIKTAVHKTPTDSCCICVTDSSIK